MTDAGTRTDWRRRLDGFVIDLGAGEDRVPLERVLRRHRTAFDAVLATGRTWPQIARALTDAGARHKQGQPMSAKQLRTVYGRTGTARADHGPTSVADAVSAAAITEVPVRRGVAEPRPTRSADKPTSLPRAELAGGERVLSRLAEARRTRAALKNEFEE